KKGVYHGTPEILEQPLIALVFDAPARNPSDAVWLNPEESPDVFLNK
ncbi:MAG: cupin domain-containing protein, partial [Acidobacteria bacterium]|nr:cupin domain-containing protein [Acidobacteriota bacterium]